MKNLISLLTLLILVIQFAHGQALPIPDNYSIVDTVVGDLDNDSINELVIAYDIGPKNEIEGTTREIIIFKLENNKWIKWQRSSQALYGSRDGGMMGDPFGEMHIKNGILQISQNGGSSWKWGFTDKYRFQDGEFYLIGYESIAGKPCEYWESVDYNLTTGKLILEKEYEECDTDEQGIYKKENETFFEEGLKITLKQRQNHEIKITSPKYGHDIFIAIGKE